MGYPTYYHPAMYNRPETNVNVYDEEISMLSQDNTKHHSFYQDISSSFASQT
jgi:predicted small secreted protein